MRYSFTFADYMKGFLLYFFQSIVTSDVNFSYSAGTQRLPLQKELQPPHIVSFPGGHTENWGETNMPDASPRTDTSTDDTADKNQRVISLFNPSFWHLV